MSKTHFWSLVAVIGTVLVAGCGSDELPPPAPTYWNSTFHADPVTAATWEGYWYSRYNLGSLSMKSGSGVMLMDASMMTALMNVMMSSSDATSTAVMPINPYLLLRVYDANDPTWVNAPSGTPMDLMDERWAMISPATTKRESAAWLIIKETQWAKQFHVDSHFGAAQGAGTDTIPGAQQRFIGGALFYEALKQGEHVENNPGSYDSTVAGGYAMLWAWMDIAAVIRPATLPGSVGNRYRGVAMDAFGSGMLTGNLTFTPASTAVTGAGTSFTGEVTAGNFIRLNAEGVWSEVGSVDSDTAITLVGNYMGMMGGTGMGSVKIPTTATAVADMYEGYASTELATLVGGADPAGVRDTALAIEALTWLAAHTTIGADATTAKAKIGTLADSLLLLTPTDSVEIAHTVRALLEAQRTVASGTKYEDRAVSLIDTLWFANYDEASGVFPDHLTYTTDDVAAVLGALNSARLNLVSALTAVQISRVDQMFGDFFESVVNISGLQISAPPAMAPMIPQYELDKLGSVEIFFRYPGMPMPPMAGGSYGVAPVFAKSVTWDPLALSWTRDMTQSESAGAMRLSNEMIWFHDAEVDGFPAVP